MGWSSFRGDDEEERWRALAGDGRGHGGAQQTLGAKKCRVGCRLAACRGQGPNANARYPRRRRGVEKLEIPQVRIDALLDPDSGLVRLAFLHSTANWFVPEVLRQFRVLAPAVRFELPGDGECETWWFRDGAAAGRTLQNVHVTVLPLERFEEVLAVAPGGVDLVVEVAPAPNQALDLAVTRVHGTIAVYANNGGAELTLPLRETFSRNLRYQFIILYTLALGGFTIPTPVPAIASLALAAFLFIVPDIDVRADARDARDEMVHALTAYLDLIALQRKGASGPRQAMTRASEISQGWVFRRIAQELRRSEFEGSRPWDALRDLARRIDVPELDSLANIMDLSERSGARVYDALRARATSLRNELQNTALAKAHAVNERMEIPIAAAAAAFMTILLTPAFLRLLNS